MNNHERLAAEGQLAVARQELEKLERQDARLGGLVKQADDLREAVAKELGRLSHEHLKARETFLFLADARGDCMASITRMRLSIQTLEESLK